MASQSHATTEVNHAAKAMQRYGIQMTMLDAGGGQSPSLDGVVQKLSQGGRAECVFFNSNVAIIATTDEHTYSATADVYDESAREFEADMRELALARMTHGEYVKHFIRSDAKPLVLDIRWLWGVEP
jgi:tRNA(Ile2) C34 agmatinyltransferase TiaS